ncbi:MAG: 3-oxoacyl-ACP reductase FabG [Anaerolineaceae bacterium]|nr:3-oxoacyl-ACP reductase FabG [Anaerolineaceae bacterium]
MNNISGKVALVTGSSRGIGAGIARSLAKEGINVAVNFFSAEKEAEKVTEQCIACGVKAIPFKADVSKPEEIEQLIGQVESQLGPIDILVNNAGRNWLRPIMEISVEEWDQTINLNLRSHFLTSKGILPGMIERGWGRIIGISSISGQRGGLSGDVDYSAAKAGIFGLTRCLARYVADKNITVNAIGLGYIWTEGLIDVPEERRNKIIDQIPVGRFGNVDECGAVAAFLASEAAAYITGEVLTVNGGVHIA